MGRSLTESQKAVKRARQQTPEYIAKRKAYDKARYAENIKKPEYLARINSEEHKAYHKAYTSTPEYKEKMKAYRATPEYKEKQRKCNKITFEKARESGYYESPKYKEYQREYRNRPEWKAFLKEYQKGEAQKAKRKEYSQTEKFKEKQRAYQSTDEYKERQRAKYRQRMDNDMDFKLQTIIRRRVGRFLQGRGRSVGLLGCSLAEARAHIESQFQDGMTWDNWSHGGWNIDHIRPCASFDLTKEEDLRACWHYTNLQPLWAKDNYAKSSIWNGKFYVKGQPL